MTEPIIGLSDAAHLRQRAEKELARRQLPDCSDLPKAQVQALVHELRVRQIELEMQNAGLLQEIAGRERTEKSLRESEQRFRLLVEQAVDGIFVSDAQGRYLDVNSAGAQMLGYAREEVLSLTIPDIIAPCEMPRVRSEIGVLSGGAVVRSEWIFRRKDGSLFPGEITSRQLPDGRLQAFLRDITERKQAEASLAETGQALERERDILRAVMDGAKNSHLVYLDRDFNFVRVNETYAQHCGYRPEEMVGKNHFALYPNAENEAIFIRARDTGEPVAYHDKPFEYRYQPERGVTYWDWTLTPVKDSTGQTSGLVFSLYETTARKRAETERQNFVSLAEQSTEFIGVCNMSFQPFFVNEAGRRLVGLDSLEQACAVKVQDYFFPEDQSFITDEFFPRVLREGHADVEVRFRHFKTGEALWMIYNVFYIRDAEGKPTGLATVSRDITARKRAELALQASERFNVEVLNAFPAHIVVLDRDGTIVSANARWHQFACANGAASAPSVAVGANYLTACRRASQQGDTLAQTVIDGLQGVLTGTLPAFQCEYPCHAPDHERWFIAQATPIPLEAGRVIVSHRDISARKKAEAALRASEERLRLAQDAGGLAMWDWHVATGQVVWNETHFRMLGYEPGSVTPSYEAWISRIHPEDRTAVETRLRQCLEQGGLYTASFRALWPDGTVRWIDARGHLEHNADGHPSRCYGIMLDTTERRQAEQERETTLALLRLVNESNGLGELVRSAVTFFRQSSGCEAVSVRLREGEDFPYFETHGFPPEFVLLENQLCARDASGEILRDDDGNPVLECMCGKVLCGRSDPAKPYFTRSGNFWSNATSTLAADLSNTKQPTHIRHRCINEGYESVALIALRVGEDRLGLLQLNDHRPGMFSAEGIELWERLAGSLSLALARLCAEKSLRENESRYRQTLESIPGMVFTTRPDGYCDYQSRQWVEFTGVPMREHLGDGWNRLLHPDDRPRAFAAWREAVEGRAPYDLEYRVRRHDGEYEWFKVRGRPIHNEAGTIVRWFGTALNIDDLVKAQNALERSERLYRAIGESIDYGVWVCEPDGRNIYSSESFLNLVGLSQKDCSDYGWGSVLHPDEAERTLSAWKECARIGGVWDVEHRFRGVDGQWHPILARGVAVRDGEGKVICWAGINLDISRLKTAEEQLRASLGEKEVLLKEIHHRVKNNLQVISSLINLQSEALRDPALKISLGDVRDRVRAMALVHEKLYQSTSLAKLDFADYAASLMQSLWRAHGSVTPRVRLKMATEPVEMPVDTAVPCGLILNELASNALKHAFRDQIDGEVTVGVARDALTGQICLRVSDNGPGLPPGLDWRRSSSLGLRLVQMLAQQLHGVVQVGDGPGTEFRVILGAPKGARSVSPEVTLPAKTEI